MQAALKGAGEIGFTIISISISLVAVLIPLLLMSGIIGRLFREFAVTLAMTIVGLGVRVADADADDGARASCKSTTQEQHGRLYQAERARLRRRWPTATSAASTSCLRHQLRHADGLPRDRRRDRSICSSSFPRASSRSRTPASSSARPRRPGHLVRRRWSQAAGAARRDRAGRSRTSTRWRWRSAPASATPRRTTAACSSR